MHNIDFYLYCLVQKVLAMATIHREIPIESTVDAAWEKLSDLGGVQNMLSILSDASVDGDRRVCGLAAGGRLDELILSVDSDRHRVAYAIVDSPFDLEFHAASMSLVADGDAAKFVWTTDLNPDEASAQIAELIESETNNIKAFFAGGA